MLKSKIQSLLLAALALNLGLFTSNAFAQDEKPDTEMMTPDEPSAPPAQGQNMKKGKMRDKLPPAPSDESCPNCGAPKDDADMPPPPSGDDTDTPPPSDQ